MTGGELELEMLKDICGIMLLRYAEVALAQGQKVKQP